MAAVAVQQDISRVVLELLGKAMQGEQVHQRFQLAVVVQVVRVQMQRQLVVRVVQVRQILYQVVPYFMRVVVVGQQR